MVKLKFINLFLFSIYGIVKKRWDLLSSRNIFQLILILRYKFHVKCLGSYGDESEDKQHSSPSVLFVGMQTKILSLHTQDCDCTVITRYVHDYKTLC